MPCASQAPEAPASPSFRSCGHTPLLPPDEGMLDTGAGSGACPVAVLDMLPHRPASWLLAMHAADDAWSIRPICRVGPHFGAGVGGGRVDPVAAIQKTKKPTEGATVHDLKLGLLIRQPGKCL